MPLKSINAMPLMLRLMRLLLAKAILLATIKIVYFSEFSSFAVLKIGLVGAMPLYSSARYFMPFK
jgi:hypothetical protein